MSSPRKFDIFSENLSEKIVRLNKCMALSCYGVNIESFHDMDAVAKTLEPNIGLASDYSKELIEKCDTNLSNDQDLTYLHALIILRRIDLLPALFENPEFKKHNYECKISEKNGNSIHRKNNVVTVSLNEPGRIDIRRNALYLELEIQLATKTLGQYYSKDTSSINIAPLQLLLENGVQVLPQTSSMNHFLGTLYQGFAHRMNKPDFISLMALLCTYEKTLLEKFQNYVDQNTDDKVLKQFSSSMESSFQEISKRIDKDFQFKIKEGVSQQAMSFDDNFDTCTPS